MAVVRFVCFLGNAADALGRSEPTAEVSKSCCARSQHENRRDRIIFGLAARRENQPFMHVAARKRARISRLRDKAAAPVAGDNGCRPPYCEPSSL